jgi:hypothetical protein
VCCALLVVMFETVEETAAPVTWTPVAAIPTALPAFVTELPTPTPSVEAVTGSETDKLAAHCLLLWYLFP